jgi:L-asparaginase/Glu-tRNA(Gln) amidotransferase subunit D
MPANPDSQYHIGHLATGGTIQSKGNSSTDTTHYEVAASGLKHLIDAIQVPLSEGPRVVSHQSRMLDSIDFGAEDLLCFYHEISDMLRQPGALGVVVTTGSSTLAQFAKFLEHTLDPNKRVILTAAFKPYTAYGADGPGNLLASIHAITTTTWEGVGIIANDQFFRPHGTVKKNGYFKLRPGTRLAYIRNFRLRFNPHQRDIPKTIDISTLSPEYELPRVEVITRSFDFDVRIVEDAIARKVGGLIFIGYDDGYWPSKSRYRIEELAQEYPHIVMVMVSHDPTITVEYERVAGLMRGGEWNPDQLQAILPFVLYSMHSREKIQEFILEPFHPAGSEKQR